MKEKISFNVIANAVLGYQGLSGGDDIFINFSKQLIKKGVEVNIFTWKHGYLMCRKNDLDEKKVNFFLSAAGRYEKWPFFLLYLVRTILGMLEVGKIIKQGYFQGKKVIVYSASDFYPDSLPGLLMKLLLPQSRWLAGFYLFAPNPFKGFRGELSLKNFLFWLSQRPIFFLIRKYADIICVTSEPDVVPFIKTGRKREDIFVVKGGIDYGHLKKFQKPVKKVYDAVFVGRFHPQKGVVEMIDIWNEVVKKIPKAKLAIIGLGPMEVEMKKRIGEFKLEKNIKFLGVMIGDDRNRILQQSKIVLHPAVYDSGGMAAASGLACGLPGVSFDLPVFKTYYPRGFLRAELGNFADFAQKIVLLLTDTNQYQKMSDEAVREAKTWDWQDRTDQFMQTISRKF